MHVGGCKILQKGACAHACALYRRGGGKRGGGRPRTCSTVYPKLPQRALRMMALCSVSAVVISSGLCFIRSGGLGGGRGGGCVVCPLQFIHLCLPALVCVCMRVRGCCSRGAGHGRQLTPPPHPSGPLRHWRDTGLPPLPSFLDEPNNTDLQQSPAAGGPAHPWSAFAGLPSGACLCAQQQKGGWVDAPAAAAAAAAPPPPPMPLTPLTRVALDVGHDDGDLAAQRLALDALAQVEVVLQHGRALAAPEAHLVREPQ